MYLHTGASEGACQFWDYHDKVQVEGRLLALPGLRPLPQPPRQSGIEYYRSLLGLCQRSTPGAHKKVTIPFEFCSERII